MIIIIIEKKMSILCQFMKKVKEIQNEITRMKEFF